VIAKKAANANTPNRIRSLVRRSQRRIGSSV
jgi:hypothetical protein